MRRTSEQHQNPDRTFSKWIRYNRIICFSLVFFLLKNEFASMRTRSTSEYSLWIKQARWEIETRIWGLKWEINFQWLESESSERALLCPATLHWCKIASSKAFLTALRSVCFLDSINFALSRSGSTPSGSSLSLGNHCLLAQNNSLEKNALV